MIRREFLTLGSLSLLSACAGSGLTGSPGSRLSAPIAPAGLEPDDFAAALLAAETAPVLLRSLLDAPAMIREISLLAGEGQYVVRVRDSDGAEGFSVANPNHMNSVWPLFLRRVIPTYIGRDARDLEAIQADNYRYQLNYKWQGLAYWCCHAWLEFAILDLLGRKSGHSVGDWLGGRLREKTGVYYASGNRGNSPEAEIEHLQGLVNEIGAKALKFRLGARLYHDDVSNSRDLALIPGVRKAFGDDMILYADANSSYDIPTALRMGLLLEAEGYAFYEEPVPFDHYDETRSVADALTIPIAFGEQEVSMRRFRWLVENDAAQVIQPDLLFNGGLIRAIRVARMAALRGYPCVPHMSGGGLGSLYVLHFASAVPNTTGHQEYKGEEKIPFVLTGTGPFAGRKPVISNSEVAIPDGPGLGFALDPDFLAKLTPLSA